MSERSLFISIMLCGLSFPALIFFDNYQRNSVKERHDEAIQQLKCLEVGGKSYKAESDIYICLVKEKGE